VVTRELGSQKRACSEIWNVSRPPVTPFCVPKQTRRTGSSSRSSMIDTTQRVSSLRPLADVAVSPRHHAGTLPVPRSPTVRARLDDVEVRHLAALNAGMARSWRWFRYASKSSVW